MKWSVFFSFSVIQAHLQSVVFESPRCSTSLVSSFYSSLYCLYFLGNIYPIIMPQTLAVGLTIGVIAIFVIAALFCYACRQFLKPFLQTDLESGRRRANGPSSYPNSQYRMPSWPHQPQSEILDNNQESHWNILESQRYPAELDVTQPSPTQEPTSIPLEEIRPVPPKSKRTRRRTRTHPLANLSGQELRALDRGRLNSLPLPQEPDHAGNNNENPRPEPGVELVGDGLSGSFPIAYHQRSQFQMFENPAAMSTASIDSDSDPRVSPILRPIPDSIPGISAWRRGRSPYKPSTTNGQNTDSKPDNIDEWISAQHHPPPTSQPSTSSSDPAPPPTRRRRHRTTESSSNRNQDRPEEPRNRPRRRQNVAFDDGRNKTFVLPPTRSPSPVKPLSPNHHRHHQRDERRPPSPMPGTWPGSSTISSPPISEEGVRLRETTGRNTAVNGVRGLGTRR